MPEDPFKGPISEEKSALVPASKEEIEKAFPEAVFREVFVVREERPTVTISARIPESLNRLIGELILHPSTPWTNTSDFVKSAIFVLARGATQLFKDRGFDVGSMMPFLSKLEMLHQEAKRQLALKRAVDYTDEINESIEPYIKEEAWGDLLAQLEEYARILNEMPSGFYAQLAITKFFTQSNVAEALRTFRVKKIKLPPNLLAAERKFRRLRK